MKNRKRLKILVAIVFIIANLVFWIVFKQDISLFMFGVWLGILIILV